MQSGSCYAGDALWEEANCHGETYHSMGERMGGVCALLLSLLLEPFMQQIWHGFSPMTFILCASWSLCRLLDSYRSTTSKNSSGQD